MLYIIKIELKNGRKFLKGRGRGGKGFNFLIKKFVSSSLPYRKFLNTLLDRIYIGNANVLMLFFTAVYLKLFFIGKPLIRNYKYVLKVSLFLHNSESIRSFGVLTIFKNTKNFIRIINHTFVWKTIYCNRKKFEIRFA